VIVNGVRFNTDSAQIITEDSDALRLGMTVLVTGSIQPDLMTGTATTVLSVPEFRAAVSALNAAGGWMEVSGTRVLVDEATIYDGFTSLSSIAVGSTVQVYALPVGDGGWRASRIERKNSSLPLILSGAVGQLDTVSKTFSLGGMLINYGAASFGGTLVESSLANGMVVYVRATALPVNGVLNAQQIRRGHALPTGGSFAASLLGIVSGFEGLNTDFLMYGQRVNIASAQITGGPVSSIGNGVRLEVAGTMAGGVLIAKRARIRYVPGAGGPASFQLIGTVGQYRSVADFRVNGQPVDASSKSVVFTNGAAKDLRNGVRVSVHGSHLVSGVLRATEIRFE